MDPPTSKVCQACFNFLPDVNPVHEVIPRRGGRKRTHQSNGLRPNAASFRFCGGHGGNLVVPRFLASETFLGQRQR